MKLLLLFLAVAVCNAAVELEDFFPYGSAAGDQFLPENDDDSSPEIRLSPFVFPFVIKRETSLWLSNNGFISFAGAISTSTAECGPVGDASRMIAIFWTDIDTRKGGFVQYRQTTDRRLLQKAATDVVKRYPTLIGLKLEWLFIATWEGVAPFNLTNSWGPGGNTFQLILTTDGTSSFVLYYYNKITFTRGSTGHAKVGLDVGDGIHFIQIDGSCSSEIGNIVHWSNIDVPGKFVFRVDNVNIAVLCEDDSTYADGREKLRVTPAVVDTLGHVPVAFQGPCFSETAKATCTFYDNQIGPLEMNGSVAVPPHGIPTVNCLTPYFFGLGRTAVDVTLTEDSGSSVTYSAYLSVASLRPSVQYRVMLPEFDLFNDSGILGTNHSIISLQWDSTTPLIQGISTVDITMAWFDADKNSMDDLLSLATGLPNNGSAKIRYRGLLPAGTDKVKLARSFVTIAISPNNNFGSADAIFSDVRLFTSYLPSVIVISGIGQSLKKQFIMSAAPQNMPKCPCTELQARNDPNFVKEGLSPSSINFFHPSGAMSYLNSAPMPGTSSGQQCVYDAKGSIVVGVAYKGSKVVTGGGTADKYNPTISALGHFYDDVLPWFIYCNVSGSKDACRKHYDLRPSDNCFDYRPPTPSQGSGDPHLTSFDGRQFTFNGVGEFVMVEGSINGLDNGAEFGMQARMEQFGSSNASVFTAFAIKQGATIVQVQLSQVSTVDILVNGYPLHFDGSSSGFTSQTFNKEVSVAALSDDLSQVLVSLSSGISFVITTSPTEGIMAISVSSTDPNKGELRGLLGNFDGNPNNDFQAPDGTILDPNTATLRDIHFEFGLKWMITEVQSLFVYSPGKSYSSYARPDFIPTLEMPDISTMPQEAVNLCGSSMACLFDYKATDGSIAVASLTLAAEQRFNESIEAMQQIVLLCENIGFPENGYTYFTNGILIGSEATFECDEGYLLQGSISALCSVTETGAAAWDSTPPACVSTAGPEAWVIAISVIGALLFIAIVILSAFFIKRKFFKKEPKTEI